MREIDTYFDLDSNEFGYMINGGDIDLLFYNIKMHKEYVVYNGRFISYHKGNFLKEKLCKQDLEYSNLDKIETVILDFVNEVNSKQKQKLIDNL